MTNRRADHPGLAAGALLVLLLLSLPSAAEAYVGPGAGFAFVTSFFVLLTTGALALLALVSWPARWLWRLAFGKRPPNTPAARRVVVVGLDGLDPRILERLMDAGELPTFSWSSLVAWGLVAWGSLGTVLLSCDFRDGPVILRFQGRSCYLAISGTVLLF